MNDCKICVVGAGIVGLSTAEQIQKSIPNAQVTLIAEKFLSETTSHGAAGIFRPGQNFCGPNRKITMKWLLDSYLFYQGILKHSTPETANAIGVTRRKVCMISTKSLEDVRNSFLENILEDYHICSQNEVEKILGKGQQKFVSTFTTMVVECRKYLPHLLKRFEQNGGKVIKSKLESFEELAGKYDLVFNCSGLGAKHLCQDQSLTPIRGQVYKVNASWITEALYYDSDTYIIPGTDGMVTLGGTRQFDSTNESVDKHDSAAIWERCTLADKSLWNSKYVQEWVGFRPYRPQVRVEKEMLTFPSGNSLKIIHNYGHGAYGVTSAPGTSMYAVSLGIEALKERTGITKSKL